MYICENYTDALKKLTDEDLKRVIEDFDIDEYKSRCNSYSNAFYLMNLREDTHSEFLAWLFDCSKGVPGMALVYGEPGLGKTRVATWWSANNDAIFVSAT